MKSHTRRRRLIAQTLSAAALFGALAMQSRADLWSVASFTFFVQAEASGESPFDDFFSRKGGGSSGVGLSDSRTFDANGSLVDGDGSSTASAFASYAAVGNVLSLSANAGSDVDPGDFMIAGLASGVASVTVDFALPAGGTYRVIDGNFGGTHADSTGSLGPVGGDPILSFSMGTQPNGEQGNLAPGTYRIVVESSAYSNFNFFNGLFAGSSCTLDIEVIPAATCVGDLTADNQVDDADFQLFAVAYDLLDCADPAMPAGCPADLNADGFVDDLDFQLFAVAYDQLICP
jgi:hypothetical protein